MPGLVKAARLNTVDLVFTVHTTSGRTVEVWLLEIECSFDSGKRRRWQLYLAAYASEFDAEARLILFAPEPGLRGKIRRRQVPYVHPRPILIEPDQIERITDYAEARRRPELTILGCLYHSHEPAAFGDRVAVFRAAWIAIQSLASIPAQRYAVLVMSLVPPAVTKRGIEELRERGELDERHYEEFTESERKGSSFHRGLEEGRKEGREEGRKEGRKAGERRVLRRAVIDLLELRGLVPTPAQRRRIDACKSLATLERWYAAAKAAAANQPIDELLR